MVKKLHNSLRYEKIRVDIDRGDSMPDFIENVRLSDDGKAVVILDQTQLPNRKVYLRLETAEDIYDAIYLLKVRGAPAIGICGAYGMYCLALQMRGKDKPEFVREFDRYKKYLMASRPTAVNLSWGLNRMEAVIKKHREENTEEICRHLREEALAIQREDVEMCRSISEYGLSLIRDGDGILTHCNAGPLATSRYGTALGPLLLGREKGMNFRVFADETRPLLQGARLTSYELQNAGVDVTLICDNMAGTVMKNGWVQACFVGCDRVAANGDTANKIGTSQVAILAAYYKIPFYVLGPTSTIDLECPSGDSIPVEIRDGREIKDKFYRESMAPLSVKCYNPAFDITDHSLISGIVTEYGICRPPYTDSLRMIFQKKGETR